MAQTIFGRSGSVVEDERAGPPLTSRTDENINKSNGILLKDRSLSVGRIYDISNIDIVEIKSSASRS
ncbi:hypothetical protein TNCV_1208021 [Trichonephila clavipes]|nr:hypothetical protein TNCV_1208021 [Trichonephila clavipes]